MPQIPFLMNVRRFWISLGGDLSADEKKIIAEIIRNDFLYKLGLVEKEQEHEFGLFILMLSAAWKPSLWTRTEHPNKFWLSFH